MPKPTPSTTPTEPSATAAPPTATADDRPPLPPGWVWATFDDVFSVVPITHNKVKVSDYLPTGKIPIIDQGSKFIGGFTNDVSKQVQCKLPVIVFGDHTKHVKYVDFPFAAGADGIKVLEPRPIVIAKYAFYFLQLRDLLPNKGYARHFQFLRKARFPLAPLPEQRRIVAKIEELFSQLDAAEEGLRRVQRNLKRYRAAVLKAAVEGRLVPRRGVAPLRPDETGAELLQRILAKRRRKWEEQEWAKLVEKAKKKAAQARRKAQGRPARLKDIPPEEWQAIPEEEYRRYLPKDDRWKQRYKEPTPPDTANLPPLPEGWVWATVGQLGEVSGGITKNRKRSRLPIQMPYLRVANVYANELRLDDVARIGVEEREIPKALLQEGDLLIVEGNGSIEQIGRVAIWDGRIKPCLHQNHIIKVRFVLPEVVHYALYWLLSQGGRAQIMRVASSTSGLYTLSLSKVEHLPVPLPPLAEQRRIVAEVERRLSVAREAEKAVEANLKRIARLRQAILKRAFEGRLLSQ